MQSFCNKLIRDPLSGQIVQLSRGNTNLGSLGTKGIDLSLSYRVPITSFGKFGIRSESTYTKSYTIRSTDIAEPIDYAGEYLYNRFKGNVAVDWSLGNWSATLNNRYYSGVQDRCWTVIPAVECSDPTAKTSWGTGANKIGATVYTDLNVSYKFAWKGTLAVGANNVFDKQPRIAYGAASANGGTSSSSSVDAELPIDRFVYMRYNQAF